MSDRKLKKAEAGYQMLQILSAVDGEFKAEEDIVIRKFLIDYPLTDYQMEAETDVMSSLATDEYILHFHKAMDDFYDDSTPSERNKFLDLAVQLIAADHSISKDENVFINDLFDAWAPGE